MRRPAFIWYFKEPRPVAFSLPTAQLDRLANANAGTTQTFNTVRNHRVTALTIERESGDARVADVTAGVDFLRRLGV
jgi:hypothetical protein